MPARKIPGCSANVAVPAKRPQTTIPVPTEAQEQKVLVQWLEANRVLFVHVPNGRKRGNPITGRLLKLEGARPGFPDLLVFDIPPAAPSYRGVAIELKRVTGGRVSGAQKQWFQDLRERGWFVAVCAGAGEAIATLQRLGYGKRGG